MQPVIVHSDTSSYIDTEVHFVKKYYLFKFYVDQQVENMKKKLQIILLLVINHYLNKLIIGMININ